MEPRLFCNYIKTSIKNSALNRLGSGWLRLLLAFWLSSTPALAIDRATLELLTQPLEPALFQPNATLDPSVGTPDRISQTGLTPPSLWWTREQFGTNLLSYWLAYPAQDLLPARVDLIVDQQVWGSYNYVQRYAFMNQFGTAAKEFRYNLRVFNLQGDLLGAQICQFRPQLTNLDAACSIFLNPYGRSAFRGSATPGLSPAALPSTGGDRSPGR